MIPLGVEMALISLTVSALNIFCGDLSAQKGILWNGL